MCPVFSVVNCWASSARLAGYANACASSPAPKDKLCGEGHAAPNVNWMSKKCGFLHNKKKKTWQLELE